MATYSKAQIDDLLYRCDLVDLIGRHLDIKKSGTNYLACCPFHQEKTPSFSISPQKQFYYCFGCQANGNALNFLMEYHKLSFPESVQELAKIVGVQLEPIPGSHSTPKLPTISQSLLHSLSTAQAFYQQALQSPEAKRARHYLHRRGITAEWANQFGLGFAYGDWDRLLKEVFKGIPDQAIEAGLIIEKQPGRCYDRFRGRLMFPIKNRKGQVVGFGGRVLDNGEPKYLNSPETPAFQKQQLLYGLYEALNHRTHIDQFIIVEGYMDVIALAQAGLPYAVATLGTSTSEHHIQQLYRHVNKLYFCFDGDNAGEKAAEKALNSLLPYMKEGREAEFIFLPKGEDPDTLIRKSGKEAMEQQLQQAVPLSQLLQSKLSQGLNLMTLDGKARFAQRAMQPLSLLENNLYRQLLIEALADHAHIRPELLTQAQTKTKTASVSKTSRSQGKQTRFPSVAVSSSKHIQPRQLIDQMIMMLIKNPKISQDLHFSEDLLGIHDLPHFQLLQVLQSTFSKNPETSLAYLFGQWHNSEQGHLLAQLAAQEYLLQASEQGHELQDALSQLERLAIDLLLAEEKQKDRPDQARILSLIQKKATLSTQLSLETD